MFNVSLDVSELEDLYEITGFVDKATKKAQYNLAKQTELHIKAQAQQKLHSRRNMYVSGLDVYEDNGDYVVSLDASVRWIEDGMKPHSMLEDLLASPKAKIGKDGKKYLVVPFQLNKTKQDMTPAQQTLMNTVQKALKDVGASGGGIETDSEGAPKLGLVRTLDITDKPVKLFEGPQQGKGPIGDVRQGPTGIPFLQGVRVYQNKYTKQNGEQGVKRTVMTFRVASENHLNDDARWFHPGIQGVNLFEEAARWAQDLFDRVIGPQISQQIVAELGEG